jgi:hypothetical protein
VRLGIIRVVHGPAQQLPCEVGSLVLAARSYQIFHEYTSWLSRYPATQRILLLTIYGPSRALCDSRCRSNWRRSDLLLTTSGPSRLQRGFHLQWGITDASDEGFHPVEEGIGWSKSEVSVQVKRD